MQSISKIKALIISGCILALFCLISFLVQLPAMGQARLMTHLDGAGFEIIKIGSLSYDMGGLVAENITLDAHGFDTIAAINARYSWISFLTGSNVDEIKITGLSLSRSGQDIQLTLQNILKNLTRQYNNRLIIENATLNLSTIFGELRFIIDASIEPQTDKGDPQKIVASINTNQYQLGFASKWIGSLSADGALNMSADIADGRMHFGPIEITRYAGWVSLDAAAMKFSLQSQIDAGGAAIFNIPMQDISLVTDIAGSENTILFRSSMAGLKDVTLSSDWTRDKYKQNQFDVTLKGENMAAFFERLAADREDSTIPAALMKPSPFQIQALYQPDRRFAGGPLPFALQGQRGGDKMLFGNFLIYPEELDLRGSAEIDPELSKAFATFFHIDANQIDRNFIRLDSDLTPALGLQKQ